MMSVCIIERRIGVILMCIFFFFFKQKTAYEMRISDWSSDVCSADLDGSSRPRKTDRRDIHARHEPPEHRSPDAWRRQLRAHKKIGRASCRERVCKYV